MNKFIEQLKKIGACGEELEWIEERGIDTVEEFWEVSDRGDWMLWLVHQEYPGIDIPIRIIQDLAIEFAEMALPYAGKHRQVCIDCIYATWQYLDGWIDIDELKEKQKATWFFERPFVDAANAAANAAANTACAACAANTACAAYASSAACAYYSTYASWFKVRKIQADMIRRYVPEVGR